MNINAIKNKIKILIKGKRISAASISLELKALTAASHRTTTARGGGGGGDNNKNSGHSGNEVQNTQT